MSKKLQNAGISIVIIIIWFYLSHIVGSRRFSDSSLTLIMLIGIVDFAISIAGIVMVIRRFIVGKNKSSFSYTFAGCFNIYFGGFSLSQPGSYETADLLFLIFKALVLFTGIFILTDIFAAEKNRKLMKNYKYRK